MNYNKCATPMQDVNNKEDKGYSGRREGANANSVLSTHFSANLKPLKKKSPLKTDREFK